MSNLMTDTAIIERLFATNATNQIENINYPPRLGHHHMQINTPAPHSTYAPVLIFKNTNNDTDVTDNKTRDCANTIPTAVIYCAMSDKYHREVERLKTFEQWPLQWLDKKQLAMTGMRYVGEDDKVKCYFCEVEIGRWEPDDHPVSEHLRWSPNCPLLRRRTTNNVPIDAAALDSILPPQSYDVCGNESLDVRPHAYAESPINLEGVTRMSQLSPLPFYPVFREYAIEAARVRSFNEWPRHMKQKPEQMAEAGFFYTGTGDRVKCFSCGGGLKDWDENDDPWEQHAIWLTNCRYLKLIKDQQFIDDAIAKQKANDAAEVAANRMHAAAVGNVDASAESAQATESFCGDAVTTMCALTSTPMPASELQQLNTATNTANSTITTQPQAGIVSTTNVAAVPCEHKPQQQQQNGCASDDTITTKTETAIASKPVTPPTTTTRTTATPTIPEEKLCKICYAGEYNTAFLPCGHVVACAKCASSVTKCPLCRKPFTDVMRVYFS